MTTTDSNFLATGPGVGVNAEAEQNDGLHIGVRGVGSSQSATEIEQSTGVLGLTTTLGGGTVGNGTGVRGVTSGGTGVMGVNTGGQGFGVLGRSEANGIGVQGESAQGPGVFGRGGTLGVEGTSDSIGVLGGAPIGRVFNSLGQFGIGIVGNGIGDVRSGDVPFAYGGWFDAINGTAPVHLEPSAATAPPSAAWRGDLFVDSAGKLWFCTDSGDGNPDSAVWRQVQLV